MHGSPVEIREAKVKSSYKPREYSKLVRRNYNSIEREIHTGQFC